MCGIFGLIDSDHIDRPRFEQSLALLRHRGPDDLNTRYWRHMAFGFTRLAIQDLSKLGNQPMSHPDQPIHIVFNGEIYNCQALRERLIAQGARFVSHSDTEVILHAYHHWGWDETLRQLEGMYSLSLFDEGRHTVYLARDRFGQKPLFYTFVTASEIIFGSEIKAILHYQKQARLDFRNSLNPLFTTGLSPRGETMFANIKQLEEGSYLKCDLLSHRIEIQRYFSVFDWVSEPFYRELSQYSEKKMLDVCESAFKEAVQRHLVSDAPLASLFSAGLDSSLVTFFATQFRNIDLYHFESELHDFLRYPKFFSKKYNQKLILKKGEDLHYIFKLPKMVYHYETINKEEGVVLADLCRFARRDGIKVLLTGDAADELFAGYPSHEHFMTRNSLHNSRAYSTLYKAINRVFPGTILKGSSDDPLGLVYNINPPGEAFYEVPSNCLFHGGQRLEEWQRCLNAYDFIRDKNERDLMAYLLDEVHYRLQRFMIRADRFGMMESVELRLPFLDSRIAQLAVNMPTPWRLRKKRFCRGYERKYILKQLAVRQGMPHWYAYRSKQITPHNSKPQMTKLLKHWKLENLSDFLKIQEKTLKHIALESFDREISRIQYGFLSMEILMRLFIRHQSCEEIEEEFARIILN